MGSGSSPAEILARVVRTLDRAEIPYMVTGSVAASRHGSPRSTQDIDIVLSTDEAGLERLLREFPDTAYYVSRDSAVDALAKESMFNVIDLASGWKIDFIFRKSRAFSREEFERRKSGEALGVRLSIVTPEDLLISKLEWAKIGESERQIRDAAGVIATQGAALDRAYIERWVDILGLKAQWEAARAAVP